MYETLLTKKKDHNTRNLQADYGFKMNFAKHDISLKT